MKRLLYSHKLNQRGFNHILAIIICVVGAALIGTYMLVFTYASPWRGVLELSSADSGYCLTASGSSANSKVVLDPCSKTVDNNQIWSINNTKTSTVLGRTNVQEFTLQSSAGSNQCLNNPYGSKTNGTAMQIYSCNNSDADNIWFWGGATGGSAHQLTNLASISDEKGLCLDDAYGSHVASIKIQGYSCRTSNQSNQEWYEATTPSGSSVSTSTIHYVALGDSVASGEGINYGWTFTNGTWNQTGPANPVWEPTTDLSAATQDCHRSAQAYPYLIATATNYKLLDLSCSGASIPEGVLGPIQFDKSTTGPAQLGSNQSISGYSSPNTAYDTFKPDLVTITLGLDDVDFSDVLTNCYTGPCGTTSQNASMDASITSFSANLKTLLAQIDSRGTSDGKIPWVVLTTYYDPFNPSALSCGDINLGLGFGLSSSDVSWLQSKLTLINQDIVADSSSYPKAKVANLSDVMAGHQLCSTNPWIYGPSIIFDDLNSPAPFHPTPSGQQAIAKVILTTIESLNL